MAMVMMMVMLMMLMIMTNRMVMMMGMMTIGMTMIKYPSSSHALGKQEKGRLLIFSMNAVRLGFRKVKLLRWCNLLINIFLVLLSQPFI